MAVVARPARGSFRKRFLNEEARAGYLFVSPFIVGFLIFTGGPLIASLYLSFTSYDVINPPFFVGLDNYTSLPGDERFWHSLQNSFTYLALHLPTGLPFAFLLALLLNLRVRALSFWRGAFYLPKVTPLVAASVLWLRILSPNNGLLNDALATIGIHGPAWTIDAEWVKPSLAIMALWTVGTWVIIYLAGLQDVPKELYEAASLDGANALQRLWHVTLPMLSRVIFFSVVVVTIASLNIFDQAYVMFPPQVFGGQAGPQDSALFYMLYLFQQAFTYFHMGYASALAWVLFFITLAITAVQLQVSKRLVYTESGR